jgi:hypothetical protein
MLLLFLSFMFNSSLLKDEKIVAIIDRNVKMIVPDIEARVIKIHHHFLSQLLQT